MRKEVPRDSATSRGARVVAKGVKRASDSTEKVVIKKKTLPRIVESEASKSSAQVQTNSKGKTKTVKPKGALTKVKLSSGTSQGLKSKVAKDGKKEHSFKLLKQKPKKVVVSKCNKKVVKLEGDPKRAAKIVRAVKDVKKARTVVASKLAKTVTKKGDSCRTGRKPSEGSMNVINKHSIVKRVKRMSGKKPCVVSVKISNAHSTVTLSVKQNKQVGKKESTKNSITCESKGSERSTISILKKGIASRRKSTSKECAPQESVSHTSPTRDTSPVKSREGKPAKVKKSSHVKQMKNIVSSVESKSSADEKCGDDLKDGVGTTELIINENVKITTENIGDNQNMEIEFTNPSAMKRCDEKECKSSFGEHKEPDNKESKFKSGPDISDFKVKQSLIDYSNLKSIDSSTSDEIPLESLKSKQKITKREDSESGNKSPEIGNVEKNKKSKDRFTSDATDYLGTCHEQAISAADKKKSDIAKQQKLINTKSITKNELKKFDQESVAKFKISATTKEKLKDIALKNKIAKLVKKSKLAGHKHKSPKDDDEKGSDDSDQSRRRGKLLKFWNGPKRHRVASLNAIAKVHCLYENESRGALNDVISSAAALQRAIQESKALAGKSNNKEKKPTVNKPVMREKKQPEPVVPSRVLRTNPGVRSVGRNFDILNVISSTSLSSSSSEESSDSGEDKKKLTLQPSVKQKQEMIKKEQSEQTTDDESANKIASPCSVDNTDGVKKIKKRRRRRNELTMDLKDMVVRKRMASLNASAIMTASYSTERKSDKKKDEEVKKERKKKKKQPSSPVVEESSADEDMILRTTNNKQKMAVIVNQDTDVTITGVYVNSTTRSTHHEGFCSIAGMQYRISSTSHTQTEATAVTTETLLHSDNSAQGTASPTTTALAAPSQSYTPLSALSNMQPPGHPHHHLHAVPPPLSPLQRRPGCSSAFSAPPHHDVHGNYRWEVDMPCCSGQPSRQCYYQPAGPLISSHHHHHHTPTASGAAKQPPPRTPTPPPAPQDTPDTETPDNPPPVTYRYGGQPYYSYQYYPSHGLQYPGAQQAHYHQDVCYSPPAGYPHGYFPKGHYPPYRRYHQYYPAQDFYTQPPPNPQPPPSSQQMMVAAPPAAPTSESSYPPPAPANMADPYPPPPPQPYYPGYSAGPPPPPCYSTHSPTSRGLFLDPAFQGCPCPMQSCPKNVHTGPLTGASKGSIKNHQTTPLPPVALALPLEPPGALGPPSPARGSAGMPPPQSPALATARRGDSPPPPTGLLTISKVVMDSVLLADRVDTDFVPKTELIKLEPQYVVKVEAVDEITSSNRKRRKNLKSPVDIKRPALDMTCEGNNDLQERLIVPKEEPEKIPDPSEQEPPVLEKQFPLSDNGATVHVKDNSVAPVLTSTEVPRKRKSVSSCDSEPAEKVTKCQKLSFSNCDRESALNVTKCQTLGVTNCDSEPAPKVAKCKKQSVSSCDSDSAIKVTKCQKLSVTAKKRGRKSKHAEENIAPDTEARSEVETSSNLICRRNSKSMEKRTISSSPHLIPQVPEDDCHPKDMSEVEKKKKGPRMRKVQEKTKADHLLRSHGKIDSPVQTIKERRLSKSGTSAMVKGCPVVKKPQPMFDPSADTPINLPGLRRSIGPKWSNGWSWEGPSFKAKVFLNMDDLPESRTCYKAMRHAQGDIIRPRDCVLLKSSPRKTELPFVAKVAAMWENPEDGEMMMSLLWYYRPEHTEQGRRPEDIPDEIFASRHKDINSVACIEDKCYVLTFTEYCRYRKSMRLLEDGWSSGERMVPLLDSESYPRYNCQPPGRLAPDLVFFCRRVYDYRVKRVLKNS